jgi:enhancing lycopene biosynthesis protein 2
MINIAFIISGCGVFGGTENHEMTLAMLSISQLGGTIEVFAPNEKCNLVDPISGETKSESVNILTESAKITRGKVKDIKFLNVENFDGLVLPGGFGVAKNLSNIANFLFEENSNEDLKINEYVEKIILDFHQNKRPIVAICISPLLVASIIKGCKVTLGKISTIPKNYPIQLTCIECESDDFVSDDENLIYSTPAFMSSNNLSIIYKGIYKACEKIVC